MLYPDKDQNFSYDITFLSKILGKTFPVKTLLRILKLQEYNPIRTNGTIKTQIDYSSLTKLINEISKVFNEMPYEVSTSSLRDVLVTIVVIKNIALPEAINHAKKQKIIKEDELNRLVLDLEPEQAIEKCL
jgi:hypothetical protein